MAAKPPKKSKSRKAGDVSAGRSNTAMQQQTTTGKPVPARTANVRVKTLPKKIPNLYGDSDNKEYAETVLLMLKEEIGKKPKATVKTIQKIDVLKDGIPKPDFSRNAEDGTTAQMIKEAEARNVLISIADEQFTIMDYLTDRVRLYGASKDHINDWIHIAEEMEFLVKMVNKKDLSPTWQNILDTLIKLDYIPYSAINSRITFPIGFT